VIAHHLISVSPVFKDFGRQELEEKILRYRIFEFYYSVGLRGLAYGTQQKLLLAERREVVIKTSSYRQGFCLLSLFTVIDFFLIPKAVARLRHPGTPGNTL